MQRSGDLIQADFFENVGGLNFVDSPFKIRDQQATGGYNFEYTLTGGVKKRLGHARINSVADSNTRCLGLGLYNPSNSTTKTPIRAGSTRLQAIDTATPAFTNLSQDTASAPSAPFVANTTQPVLFKQFNTTTANILWGAGGGAGLPIGAYSTSKYTQNGVSAPTGSFSATVNTHNSGSWTTTGNYYYALVFRKASTQELGNAALDISATIVNTDDTVTLDLTSVSNIDTTLYDQIYIYRSAVSGVTAFTTGSLIAQIASNLTTFVDKGNLGNPDIASSQNIPRANNTVLDNSVLPSGTYNVLGTFKRRLVTAQNSTLYLSDTNKPESWPTTNIITLPSGGPITGLATISFTSPQAQTLDELLVIFKEREMWVLTGTSYTDFAIKYIDAIGCASQSLIVESNGFLYWIDFRGIYLWNGAGKPYYCSRPIEPLFYDDGDLDKSKFSFGVGQFYRKANQVIWYLSSKSFGEQIFALKLDIRLTLPAANQALVGGILDGVFAQDKSTIAVYSALSYIPTLGSNESLLLGDASGYLYKGYNSQADITSTAYSFTYATKWLDFGSPGQDKRVHKVVAWVYEVGNWNLLLDYWSNYTSSDAMKSTQYEPISTATGVGTALWDIALWDVALWDDYTPKLRPLVFNINPGLANSNEGDSFRFQFRNDNANEPITIAGFSVIYSIKGLNK